MRLATGAIITLTFIVYLYQTNGYGEAKDHIHNILVPFGLWCVVGGFYWVYLYIWKVPEEIWSRDQTAIQKYADLSQVLPIELISNQNGFLNPSEIQPDFCKWQFFDNIFSITVKHKFGSPVKLVCQLVETEIHSTGKHETQYLNGEIQCGVDSSNQMEFLRVTCISNYENADWRVTKKSSPIFSELAEGQGISADLRYEYEIILYKDEYRPFRKKLFLLDNGVLTFDMPSDWPVRKSTCNDC